MRPRLLGIALTVVAALILVLFVRTNIRYADQVFDATGALTESRAGSNVQGLFGYEAAVIGLLTLLVITLTALFAFQQLRYVERNLRFQIYRDLLTMIDEFETERHKIYDEFPTDTASYYWDSLSAERREQLERVCRSFDKLGMLVAQGVVPVSFLLDFHTRGIIIVWHRLGPFIKQLRQRRNQLTHMEQFHMLAIEAMMHRRMLERKALERGDNRYQNEETFDATPEERRKWRKWREGCKQKMVAVREDLAEKEGIRYLCS